MRKIRRVILINIFALLCLQVSAQKRWANVGPPGFTSTANANQSFALDPQGNPWIAYQDALQNLKLTVKRYDGNSWNNVGSPGFSPGVVEHTSIAIDKSGTPYVAFRDYANGLGLSVMKYNGTGWVLVGSPGISVWVAAAISLAIDNNGVPHVAYWDNDGATTWLKKFDGNAWVGGKLPVVFNNISVLKFDSNNLPYVACNGSGRTTVAKYVGPGWTMLGGSAFALGQASKSFFALDNNGVPYVATTLLDPNGVTVSSEVRKYNGTNWVDLGSVGIPAGSMAHYTSFAFDNYGTPHLAYIDVSNDQKAMVMKYDGSGWVTVGNPGLSAGGVSNLTLMFDKKNIPYLGYIDSAYLNRTSVMSLNCPALPKLDICAAYTDTITGQNVIGWNNNGVNNVDSYKIYREDNGIYVHIGSVPGYVNKFSDGKADPAKQSYRYRLKTLDSCWTETNLSSAIAHATIKLRFNYLYGAASVTWNRYEGIVKPTYMVKRSNNGGPFTPVAGFVFYGADTTFIDSIPPLGSNRYRVDIVSPLNCTGVKITSNIVSSWNTGVEGIISKPKVLLAPNPADNDLKITFDKAILSVEIYNISGERLMWHVVDGKTEHRVNITHLPPGTYCVRLNNAYNALFIKH